MSTIRTLTSRDGLSILYRVWIPEERPIEAALLILHGMAEHSQRYTQFAEYLSERGIAVYAPDHRGHGQTATQEGRTLGYFAEKDGWNRVVADCSELCNAILLEYPKAPLFLLGHSMGSFLARCLMVQHSDIFDGVIIMGTGSSKGLLGKVGKVLARMHVAKHGPKHPDAMMDNMSFGAFNKGIESPRTRFDWLSRDNEEVDKYIADPLCGFTCTSKFFEDLLTGVEQANSTSLSKKLPSDLPVFLISGDKDPVGGYGKGVRKVYELYRDCNLADLSLSLIPDARHELLHETNRGETFEYLYSWIKTRI